MSSTTTTRSTPTRSTTTMPSLTTKDEVFPPHLLAQRLNNRGCVLLERGRYRRAITTLVGALRSSEESAEYVACSCRHCRLDECLLRVDDDDHDDDDVTTSYNRGSGCCRRGGGRGRGRADGRGSRDADIPPATEDAMPAPRSIRQDSPSFTEDTTTNNTVANTGGCFYQHQHQHTHGTSSQVYHQSINDDDHHQHHHHHHDDDDDDDDEEVGFLYARPARVHPTTIHEGHCMGVTLSLLIMFNLALAHHLQGLEGAQQQQQQQQQQQEDVVMEVDTDGEDRFTTTTSDHHIFLHKALQLYELAYQLHVDEQQDREAEDMMRATGQEPNEDDLPPPSASLRFTLLVSNNLGQLHRVMGNTDKHRSCLEHLVSQVMYLVDCKATLGGNADDSDAGSAAAANTVTSNNNSSSSSNNNSSSSSSGGTGQPDVAATQTELEGFLTNTMSIMLQKACAGAA